MISVYGTEGDKILSPKGLSSCVDVHPINLIVVSLNWVFQRYTSRGWERIGTTRTGTPPESQPLLKQGSESDSQTPPSPLCGFLSGNTPLSLLSVLYTYR